MLWILGIVFYLVGLMLALAAFLVVVFAMIVFYALQFLFGLLAAAVTELSAPSGPGSDPHNRSQARFSDRR